MMKKLKFLRFPSFRLDPISKIKNSEISENHELNWEKHWKFMIWFKNKKENFWGFRVFDCCPVTKIENWEISEIFFTSNFDSGGNLR